MARMSGGSYGSGPELLLAAAALLAACGGGGSGDTTGPPPGGADQVDSLVLNLDSVDVIVGDTVRLRAQARDAEGHVVDGVGLTFTSSNPAVVTVSEDGLVTAVDLGKADVEVAIGETAGLSLASRAAPAPSSTRVAGRRSKSIVIVTPKLEITPGEQSIEPGATSQYSVKVTRSDGGPLGNYPKITWNSSNLSVATIDVAGLATAVTEGDTRVTATVWAGGIPLLHTSVTLHVGLCGGIFKVAGWDGVADVQYVASGTDRRASAKYEVNQTSTSIVSLAKSNDFSPDSVVWEGVVTADMHIKNSVTFPVTGGKTGVTKEVKDGLQQTGPGALAVLRVRKPAAGSYACTYSFQYSDYLTWQVTNNQGAPAIPMAAPTGTALHFGASVPARSSKGTLVLGSSKVPVKLPATTLVGPTGGFRSSYMPGTWLGIMIIPLLGSPTLDPRFGTASFMYVLTATP